MPAVLDVLCTGYAAERVASTVVLVRDGGAVIVVDPGMVASRAQTAQDITTLVTTGHGLAACTHLWWSSEGPAIDPLAEDQELLERSRARLLALQPAIIIPGHGTPFAPSELQAAGQ